MTRPIMSPFIGMNSSLIRLLLAASLYTIHSFVSWLLVHQTEQFRDFSLCSYKRISLCKSCCIADLFFATIIEYDHNELKLHNKLNMGFLHPNRCFSFIEARQCIILMIYCRREML